MYAASDPPPPSTPRVFFCFFLSAARNASSAGASATEAAYSLLLDGDVTPEGMEYTNKADEFAEQCKAITLQLEEQMNMCVRVVCVHFCSYVHCFSKTHQRYTSSLRMIGVCVFMSYDTTTGRRGSDRSNRQSPGVWANKIIAKTCVFF